MTVKKSIALLGAGECVEDLLAGYCCAERDQPTRQELGVHCNVGVDAQEGRRGCTSEPIEACEDFVEDDR